MSELGPLFSVRPHVRQGRPVRGHRRRPHHRERMQEHAAPKPGERGYRAPPPEGAYDPKGTARRTLRRALEVAVQDRDAVTIAERALQEGWDDDDVEAVYDRLTLADELGVPLERVDGSSITPKARRQIALDTIYIADAVRGEGWPDGQWRSGPGRYDTRTSPVNDGLDQAQAQAIIEDFYQGKARLRVVEVAKAEAAHFIAKHHSHFPAMNTRGLLATMGVRRGGRLVGVATLTTPTGHDVDHEATVELSRVASDGTTPNVASMLTARALAIAPKLSRAGEGEPWKLVTYTELDEAGTSYRALRDRGLRPVRMTKLNRPSGQRINSTARPGRRIRWEAGPLAAPPAWGLLDAGAREHQREEDSAVRSYRMSKGSLFTSGVRRGHVRVVQGKPVPVRSHLVRSWHESPEPAPDDFNFTTTHPFYFASGANHPGELVGLGRVGHPAGVSARELSADAIDVLATLPVPVFIDSGAFSEINELGERVRPMSDEEWEDVLDVYKDMVATRSAPTVVVAPDAVGDQELTLTRMARWAPQIRALTAAGASVLVPLQRGARDLSDFWRAASELLGSEGLVPAIPSNKLAVSVAQVGRFVSDHQPEHVHLLGLGPRSRSRHGLALIDTIERLSPDTFISMDSNLMLSQVGKTNGPGGGPRLATAIRPDADAFAEDIVSHFDPETTDVERGRVIEAKAEQVAATVNALFDGTTARDVRALSPTRLHKAMEQLGLFGALPTPPVKTPKKTPRKGHPRQLKTGKVVQVTPHLATTHTAAPARPKTEGREGSRAQQAALSAWVQEIAELAPAELRRIHRELKGQGDDSPEGQWARRLARATREALAARGFTTGESHVVEREVRIERMGVFRQKMAELTRRATRLGLTPPVYRLGEVVTRKTLIEAGSAMNNYRSVYADRQFQQVEVEGPFLKLEGWTLGAKIELTPGGQPFVTATDEDQAGRIPERYRAPGMACEHCNLKRNRKATFIVLHDDGGAKQVGGECVRDYLGRSPAAAANMMSFVKEFKEEVDGLEDKPQRGGDVWRVADVLSGAAFIISQDRGEYISTRSEHGVATLSQVRNLVMGPPRKAPPQVQAYWATMRRTWDAERAVHDATAQTAVEWLRSLPPSEVGSYKERLRIIGTETEVDDDRLGLLVSTFAAMRDANVAGSGMMTPDERSLRAKQAGHIGVPGQRVGWGKKRITPLFARITFSREFAPYAYGAPPSRLYVAETDEGHFISWFQADYPLQLKPPKGADGARHINYTANRGDRVLIAGATIKAHRTRDVYQADEHPRAPETQLKRVDARPIISKMEALGALEHVERHVFEAEVDALEHRDAVGDDPERHDKEVARMRRAWERTEAAFGPTWAAHEQLVRLAATPGGQVAGHLTAAQQRRLIETATGSPSRKGAAFKALVAGGLAFDNGELTHEGIEAANALTETT